MALCACGKGTPPLQTGLLTNGFAWPVDAGAVDAGPILVPDPPQEVTATATDHVHILLSWQPPENTRGPLTAYEVCNSVATACTAIAPSILMELLDAVAVPGPTEVMAFSVIARNDSGASAPAYSNVLQNKPYAVPLSTGNASQAAAIGDFNGDGVADLFLSGHPSLTLRGLGEGRLSASSAESVGELGGWIG